MGMAELPERILVVVDPTQDSAIALERALYTAGVIDVTPDMPQRREIHVLVAPDMDNADTSAKNPLMRRDVDWFMDKLHNPLIESGLEYTLEVSWASDWYDTILQSAENYGAEMIMVPLLNRPSSTEIFFTESIWRLMRTSNCPVLAVRPNAHPRRKNILAAVHFQSHKKDTQLVNDKIIERCKWMSKIYGSEMHVANAYTDSLNYPDRSILAEKTQISSANIHVRQGAADEVISSVAKEVDADVIVMGTVSRFSRWRGNTAEQIIAKSDCDILAINK